MGVREGQTVADIGAGHGYFTVPAALIVGESGFVYSVEPDRTRSERIATRVASEGLRNVKVLNTGAERLSDIPSETVDLALSAFTLHHFHDAKAAKDEVKRILRKGGVFYVWDRVPGTIIRHGTRPERLHEIAEGFSNFELLAAGRSVRARYTK
ncbi:MAG TPA: class I SAM-dependent methyltransferase [Nitrososphaerales archaeon]|nr:class I SAM-dependent methyltransferase [Nitrososphaerales archaeon]